MSFLDKFFKGLKNMKPNWKLLNPYEKWHSFRNFVFFWGKLMQYEIFTGRSNGPPVTLASFISILSYSLIGYTTYFYIVNDQFAKCIPAYCMFGIMTSAYIVHWNLVLEKRMKWVPLLEMSGTHIYRGDKRPNAYNRICSECMDNTVRSYVITISVIILSFVGALIGPVHTYLRDGSLVTLYEVRVPFLHEDPQTEFIFNMTWQAAISILGFMGLYVVEGMIALVNNAITVSSKVVVFDLEQLSNQMEVGEISEKESGQTMSNILRKIIYGDGYIDNFADVWYWRLFLAPPTFTFSIAVSIFSQFMLKYPAGYGIALVSWVQMAVLCATGQNIVDRNERLLDGLHQSKWYLLSTEHQKAVLYMTQHLQNKQGLTIGPFEPLNYETLKILTQKVYSFLMFLMEFSA